MIPIIKQLLMIICCFQVAGIILAAIFVVHGLLAVGFKVQYNEAIFSCVATKLSFNFSTYSLEIGSK